MTTRILHCRLASILVPLAFSLLPFTLGAANYQILSWNNLGMHCMDSDYSVFSILPPYNTIEAQLIVNGRLVTSSNGYSVTYEAVADPDGSINSTAAGKGNFYSYAQSLYGASLVPDAGLAGWDMPGPGNVRQSMRFEVTNQPAPGVATLVNWYRAEGIPISPYDDAHRKNPYPLMRLTAWNTANQPVATNDTVLPVSDEMDCRTCHASGTQTAARPQAGWVWNGFPERDYRLNILRLHDEREFAQHPTLYSAALAARGFNPAGLYRNVTVNGQPVLCAACHASEALGAPSFETIPPLTASVHSFHAQVLDPALNTTLDNADNRAACYRCHPGSTTRCLRGAMGAAVAADGSMEMQCQSCHGNMTQVGSPSRVGWFMEPACQGCHAGTASPNSGLIRYTSVFTDTNGTVRVPADTTFATQPNTPANGLSLYRFSAGHGGLQCEACHGSTHAEFPASHRNDNLRNLALQGHAGVMIECAACHTNSPNTVSGGPHGMHPISQNWINNHHNLIQGNTAQCKACHGSDYRGTVLSRAQNNRSWSAFGTTVSFVRGATIGCYTCHRGPNEGDQNPSAPPSVANVSTNTTNDKAVVIPLSATGNGVVLRILSQPENGSVGLTNLAATYFPNPGFVGTDTFTFAAYDGSKNSAPGTGSVQVAQGLFSLGAAAHVPDDYPAGWPVPFAAIPLATNTTVQPAFDWNFGDGSIHDSNQFTTHSYLAVGTYTWSVICTIATVSTTNSGTITIGAPIQLTTLMAGGSLTISWPAGSADTIVEQTSSLGPLALWSWVTNQPALAQGMLSMTIPAGSATQFLRVRRPW